MTKQVINVGTTANDKKGDSLRAAFQKVNTNFTELYTALGLDSDTILSLGAFEFTGSTMTTTDSTAITIDQQVTVTSDLIMSGDIVPAADGLYNLGTLEKQWKSLHLLGSTIYFDGIPLSVSAGGTLYVNGEVAATPGGAATWDSVTGKPSMFDIGGNVIGIASSDTITEETIGGTISQTTTIESQIEIEASNIVIAKRITQVVDDGVVVSTDSTGSQFEVTDASISIKRYVEPDGPNNSSYFQIGASNGGAILEGVQENVGSNTFGRITVTQGVISITASVEGNDKEWVFDFNGDVYVPTGSAIRGANDLSLVSSADGNSGVFVNGNSLVGTAVLYATNNAIITADYDGNRKDWNFDKSGTITVPLLLPKIFTAVLDEAHMVVPITLEGDPWQYGVEFAVNPDGSVQTQMDDPNPTVDPGYSQGSVFRFTEVDHGIPGYTFDITLNYAFDEQAEVFSTNPSVTSPPEYPSTIESTGAIKLTADTSNFVFSTDGSLHFPDGSFQGTAFVGLASTAQDLYKPGEIFVGIGDGVTTTQQWSFANDGTLTLPQYGWIQGAGSNARVELNAVGTNESNLSLTTYVDGEMLTSGIDITPAIGINLNSVRRIDITAGWDSATAKWDNWQAAEQTWVDIRNQDATDIAPGTRTWAGLPSYEAYPLLMDFVQNIPQGEIPPPSSMAPAANTAKAAYELWQAEQAAINVTIRAKDKAWTFGNNGSITFPGSAILDTSDSNIELRGMNNFNVESLAAVNIITDAQGVGHSWTFNDDGSVTYPGDITQSSQDNTTCLAGVDTVVYTSTGLTRHAIKLFVMIEGLVDGSGNVETQACDVIAVKELNNDIIHVTTYGVTYTGASAIAEFDGQWNATTSRIEITCRPVSLTNSVTTSVHAIEMLSNN